MAVLASMLVGQTDRGDEMFMAMANRSGRMALDLDALALPRLNRATLQSLVRGVHTKTNSRPGRSGDPGLDHVDPLSDTHASSWGRSRKQSVESEVMDSSDRSKW